MKFVAAVQVMPKKEILDPQGKAVDLGLKNLGISNIENVRIGKHIVFEVNSNSQAEAQAVVEAACRKLLANLIVEQYEYQITPMAE